MRHKNKLFLSVAAGGVAAVLATSAAFAATIIRTELCEPFAGPTITTSSSVSPTDDTSARIDGTGEPNMALTVLDNGTGAAVTTVQPDGTFAVSIPLTPGENHVVANETDACNVSKNSSEIVLLRNQPVVTTEGGSTGSGANEPITVTGLPPETGGTSENPGSEEQTTNTNNSLLTITSPRNGATIHGEKVWVSGTAPAGSIIDIYVNGDPFTRLIADAGGSFGALANLKVGDNTIRVHAATPDGDTADRSVTVHDVLVQNGNTNTGTVPYGKIAVVTLAGATLAGGAAVAVHFRIKIRHGRRLP